MTGLRNIHEAAACGDDLPLATAARAALDLDPEQPESGDRAQVRDRAERYP